MVTWRVAFDRLQGRRRIETRFRTNLLIGSTCSLSLTQKWKIYLRCGHNVLAEIEDTERTIASWA